MTPMRRLTAAAEARRGFTIIELLIVLVMGSVLVGASLELLDRQRRSARTETLRVDLQQNARFAIDMLTRELQEAGQSLDATADFGPVAVIDGSSSEPDSLFILYAEADTPVHTLQAPGNVVNTLTLTTTCADTVSDIAVGNMIYVANGGLRGVARVDSAIRSSNGKACDASNPTMVTGALTVTYSLLDNQRHGWVFKGNAAGAAAMRAAPVVYFVDRSDASNPRLMRATEYTNGAWVGVPVADNVANLQVTLAFRDGSTGLVADATDGNSENDYDDINTVQVDLSVAARRTDKDLNKGQLVTRTYSLSVTPRNQIYTRNLE